MIRVPPLNPLRAFEAAARTGSLSKAAEELHVTPTAVSRHVRSLESYLDCELFERKPSSLVLTPAGKTYAASLSRAFEEISRATRNLRSSSKALHLSVHSYTTFMVRWLMPRLASFQVKHPEVHIKLSTGYDDVKLERDRIDVWIRYGKGRWRDVHVQPVFMDRLRPFAAAGLGGVDTLAQEPERLRDYVLLRHSRRTDDWNHWLQQQGLELGSKVKTLDFDDLALVFEAAASGLGVGITQEAYLSQDILKGKFICPFATTLERNTGYFAITSLDSEKNPAVTLFLEWLERVRNLPPL